MTDVSVAKESTDCFPIVGIGASAGGLEAVCELISAIPSPCGMAFLVVQHLDPSRSSLLPEILGKQTAMPVVEATDGLPVEADRVYVIPPNTRMMVEGRRISIRPRVPTPGPPMPVDDLLDSLAKDQGSRAIGVILSGSGSDGALGLKAIQDEGGITFAQDEASAQFASMPRAAIALACVDLVLSPRQIAAEIVRIGREGPSIADTTTSGDSANSLRPIFRLLHRACDIDFTHYKRGTIERRLARRMALRQMATVADYVVELENDPVELQALGRDLLIRVTEFFRDPRAFDALVQTVFPRFLEGREPGTPIRIWVAGCSTGEEVYSIAISLVEFLDNRLASTPVQIFATDVSIDALETARSGRYIENIARNVSAERLQRFFVRDGDHYRVGKAIRDLCTFARHNVVSDPPFSRLDLVSCRNLLIYLDPLLQRSVMPLFHYALGSAGVLMLGPSETVGGFSDLFGVIESRHTRLYSKRPRPGRPYAGLLPAVTPSLSVATRAGSVSETRREPTTAELLRREAERKALVRYAPPSVLCDDELNIVEFRGDTAAYLVNPNGPPSANLQRLARPEVFLAISDAVKTVRAEGRAVRKTGLRLETSEGVREASLEVHPVQIGELGGRWFLVFFEGPTRRAGHPPSLGPSFITTVTRAALRAVSRSGADGQDVADVEIARLSAELEAVREQLRATLEEHESAREELKSSEEELLSSNEEFQSTNEELETAKEELQSINEELSTTNDELRYRVRELRDLHDEVARSRDFAEAIIETIAEPLLVLEPDLRVTRANDAFYQTFGTTPAETIGTPLFVLGNRQWNIPALRTLLEEVLPQETSVRDYEISHEFPRIGLRRMRLNAVRVAWPGRALVLLTIDDVTRQHHALELLRTADRQKNEFLAMLAHELRNPLAAIRNGLKLWQRGDADDAVTEAAQEMAQRQLDHEIELVDDLLDVSRITSGIIALRRSAVDLVNAVRQAVAGLQSEIEARRHVISRVLPDTSVTVEGDLIRLEQIITNLVGNALKYTPDGGHIRVSLEHEKDEAVLTVTDNGIGMEKDIIPRIFDIFVQAERTLDRRSAGLGLGLTLVRRLVELHRGTVQAFSAGRGCGSQFVVRLPVLPAGSLMGQAPMGVGGAKPSRTYRILLVDDNVDAAESSAALLRLDGHVVATAADGPTALTLARTVRPEVILLDIGLPDMDGYEVARRLRAMPGQSDTILIALSGYGQQEHLRLSREAGFDRHLVKPADLDQLEALIESARPAGPAEG